MYSVVKCALILCVALAAHGFPMQPNDVIYHLYTRDNPTISEPLLPSLASISVSSFSRNRRTIIAIHSYDEDVSGNFIAFVVPAHLNAEDVNIIAVDWRHGSFGHAVGIANVPQLGEMIADFVNILIHSTIAYNANQIRIVGVGLGAHAAGVAARRIDGTIPHIVGLDPTLLGWTENPNRLSASDAALVEVLHTSSRDYGYDKPLGHLDFYANGGAEQPMCGADYSCSHLYSYIYYAESVTAEVTGSAQFVGTACNSYEDALRLTCSGTRDAIFGGKSVKTSGSGIYVFLTNFRSPFARG